jgi:hypothetical protein
LLSVLGLCLTQPFCRRKAVIHDFGSIEAFAKLHLLQDLVNLHRLKKIHLPGAKRSSMQNGSVMKSKRQNGQTVWEFRWRDRTSGKAVYRRIVLGTTEQFATEREARDAVAGIVLEINVNDPRLRTARLTISQLAEHYRRRELATDNTWKTYSTKKGYENYLRRWIVPKWGECSLDKIKPVEIELWLRELSLARSTCAKIKNVMSVLFNHARRYELFNDNPMNLVRQSAKRRRIPHILDVDQIRRLLGAVGPLPRVLIFVDATTGLRQSELFGLRWRDLDFDNGQISVLRSVVHGVISNCKTEASMKPIPMGPLLAEILKKWKNEAAMPVLMTGCSQAYGLKESGPCGDRA